MNTRRPWWLSAVGTAAFLTGCHTPVEPRIVDVTLEDPQTLRLLINTCNADLVLDVAESAEDVRITVTAENDTDDDCLDGRAVRLTEPLSDRTVTDGNTGVHWDVNAAPEPG